MNEDTPQFSEHGEKISSQRTKRAIIENLEAGPTRKPWAEIARELGIETKTIYRRLAMMRQNGTLNADNSINDEVFKGTRPSATRRRQTEAEAAKPKVLTPEELLTQITETPVMDRTQRLKTLSWIANNGVDAVKVQAISKLEDFERAAGSQYGPPPPTTDADIHENLVLLFSGLPAEQVLAAYKEAYEQKPQETAEISAPDPSSSGLGGRAPEQ